MAQLLQPGDILLGISGKQISRFDPVEQILDSTVGKEVELQICRAGCVDQLTVMLRAVLQGACGPQDQGR